MAKKKTKSNAREKGKRKEGKWKELLLVKVRGKTPDLEKWEKKIEKAVSEDSEVCVVAVPDSVTIEKYYIPLT